MRLCVPRVRRGTCLRCGAASPAGSEASWSGEAEAPPIDYERLRSMAYLAPEVWDNLHQPGKDAPFKVRSAMAAGAALRCAVCWSAHAAVLQHARMPAHALLRVPSGVPHGPCS